MFVDSHCHLDRLDLTPFANDFARFVTETLAQGIDHMLSVSVDLPGYPALSDLVRPYPCISVSVGVHPNEPGEGDPSEDELVRLAADARVVAIGETGLDYFRSQGDLSWQRQRFRVHIRAARRALKPLIVHTREARQDTLRILEEEGAGEVGGVLHCFTEDWEMARRALDLGFCISFSGVVTFRNAAVVQEVARKVPADRYLIETDSPYLAPVPYRGKPNYPSHVRHVAECLADLRGIPVTKVAEQTTANFHALFARAI